jgi:hypothetical protein
VAPAAVVAPKAAAPAPAAVVAPKAVTPAPAFALSSTDHMRPDEAFSKPRPNLESTQTLRTLTPRELQDASATRWYVVQLSLSDESFDPDSLPNLDIFNEYRLYSVAALDDGKVMHALRLGFFVEETGAAAVASYLSGFYDKPIVKRISVAERTRFADQRVEARKDIGATGRHAVIEITDERLVRAKRTTTTTATTPATATVTAMPPRPMDGAHASAARKDR